jgi:hypothetical protein
MFMGRTEMHRKGTNAGQIALYYSHGAVVSLQSGEMAMTIHQDLTSNQTLLAKIQELEAKLAAAKKAPSLGLKVTDKGGVSMYGLGKWPVTLYASQWTKLLGKAEDIKAFLEANKAQLAVKE